MASHLVVVVAYDGVELLDLAGPVQVFSAADRLLGIDAAGYDTVIAGFRPGLVRCAGGTSIVADLSWDAVPPDVGTLVVPGGLTFDAGGAVAIVPQPLVSWLTGPTRPPTARIASVCAGAHLLAAAGLLDGRRAATHWATAGQLAADHPQVKVDADAIFAQDGAVWTSAGVCSGMDLALVAADHSDELARQVARWLVMYLKRPGGQSQFSEFLAPSSAADAGIARLQTWIARHLTADLGNEALADRVGISLRHFSRRFREQVGVTPARFVESARVDAAARRLVHTDEGLPVIARIVGFGSVETLHRAFRHRFGVSPAAYRERFTSQGARHLAGRARS